VGVECERRGWSLAELARRAGKARQDIDRRVRSPIPTAATLGIVAAALGMDVRHLLAQIVEEYQRAEHDGRKILPPMLHDTKWED
jgi:transcriptional regulator with XRE-family HTH domain